ncbi:cupin domain-containing protein [Spirillospora sp. CA-294931]|uniref:cupin domain-containing protein n=1 Tax=Spirillospora sp. CA-294931 TaxID=3240042 RepID=UPI003D9411BC
MSYPEATYLGEKGEVSATLRRSSAEPDLLIGPDGLGVRVHYLATTHSTNGQFGMYRWEFGPFATGPEPHFHRTMSESFYILAGTVNLYDGETWAKATAGDYLFVPEGGVHAFRNEEGEPASMLLHFAPGAPREAYFEELADNIAQGKQLTEEETLDLYRRHDQYRA